MVFDCCLMIVVRFSFCANYDRLQNIRSPYLLLFTLILHLIIMMNTAMQKMFFQNSSIPVLNFMKVFNLALDSLNKEHAPWKFLYMIRDLLPKRLHRSTEQALN